MVNALIAAALMLSAFILSTAVLAHDRQHLALMSRVMAWLTLSAAILLPLAVLATFIAPHDMAPLNLRLYHMDPGGRLRDSVPLDDRMLAFACASVPIAIAVWGLLTLRRLFELFAAGEVFSRNTRAALVTLSIVLFFYVLASFIAEGPIDYFLLRANPARPHVFALSLGLDDLITLFIAAVGSVIARVMAEGAAVADENAKFV